MMHSATGVGLAVGETGWLHSVVAFAKPFRMPDFFLIAGLFASRIIVLPWHTFVDRRIIHFLYFYSLWVLVTLLAKAAVLEITTPATFLAAYLWAFVQPFSSMWFIYLLPLLFLAVRLTRRIHPGFALFAASLLHTAAASFPDHNAYALGSEMSGWIIIDSFSLYFVFFLIGDLHHDRIFQFAGFSASWPRAALCGLAGWALLNAGAVATGFAFIPGVTMLLGIGGAVAVTTLSSILSGIFWIRWLAYCGRHSLVIYLAFALPMGAARVLILKSGVISNIGWMSIWVTAAAIVAPLLLEALTRGAALNFLFHRPQWARLPRG